MRETVDVMDENILLALREEPQGLKSLSALASINYNTLRQRIAKLSRYGYVSKPRYGQYGLTDKGRRSVHCMVTIATYYIHSGCGCDNTIDPVCKENAGV